jgi:DNA-binding NtrC family response regulator
LVAIDHGQLRQTVKTVLLTQGWEILEASKPPQPISVAGRHTPDLVIADRCYSDSREAFAFTQDIRRLYPAIPIILVAEKSSEEQAIAALKAGINDYIKQPFAADEMVAAVRRCLSGKIALESSEGSAEVSGLMGGHRMVGESRAMCDIKAHLGRVARTGSTVLITGETGTGKELIAEMIHRQSPRRHGPFVCINCAAIPDALLESELFGYERGAFTGALSMRDGLLKQASGGTIFFDEIGDMSLYAQAKMLRAIETKTVCPLGGKRSTAVDIRIIAATNQDLKRLMEEGKFRQDLYFRLNVTRLHLPPLRQRREDIPLLLTHYLQELNRRFGSEVQGFTEQALTCLIRYEWPGNVRELKNLVEAIMVNHPSPWIDVEDCPELLSHESQEEAPPQTERDRLLAVLFSTNWNKSKAAQQLHWSRMTLYRKIEKYHLVSSPHNLASKKTD